MTDAYDILQNNSDSDVVDGCQGIEEEERMQLGWGNIRNVGKGMALLPGGAGDPTYVFVSQPLQYVPSPAKSPRRSELLPMVCVLICSLLL